jgi:hypothetical protein
VYSEGGQPRVFGLSYKNKKRKKKKDLTCSSILSKRVEKHRVLPCLLSITKAKSQTCWD